MQNRKIDILLKINTLHPDFPMSGKDGFKKRPNIVREVLSRFSLHHSALVPELCSGTHLPASSARLPLTLPTGQTPKSEIQPPQQARETSFFYFSSLLVTSTSLVGEQSSGTSASWSGDIEPAQNFPSDMGMVLDPAFTIRATAIPHRVGR
jgi:hypothetical protein